MAPKAKADAKAKGRAKAKAAPEPREPRTPAESMSTPVTGLKLQQNMVSTNRTFETFVVLQGEEIGADEKAALQRNFVTQGALALTNDPSGKLAQE